MEIKISFKNFLFVGVLVLLSLFFLICMLTSFMMRLFGLMYVSGIQLLLFLSLVFLMMFPFHYLIRLMLARFLKKGWHFGIINLLYISIMTLLLNPCMIASAQFFKGLMVPPMARMVGAITLSLLMVRFKFIKIETHINKC